MLKTIEIAALFFLAFVGFALGYFGYLWVLTPEVQLAKLGMSADSIPGMSVLRSILGTGLLTFAIMCFMFIRDRAAWFKPLLLFASLLFVARIISLVIDGVHERMVIYAALEALIVVALVFLKSVYSPTDVQS